MKANITIKRRRAFTLIELLLVIAVIAILAVIGVALFSWAGRGKIQARMQAEVQQLGLAIERYQARNGFCPPSNTNDVSQPPLYYELRGTEHIRQAGQSFYRTLDGLCTVQQALLTNYSVAGFANATVSKADPNAPQANNFHANLKQTQVDEPDPTSRQGVKYLVLPLAGPNGQKPRWHYNSFDPTNNPGTYDLWAQVTVAGQIKVFGNWKTE